MRDTVREGTARASALLRPSASLPRYAAASLPNRLPSFNPPSWPLSNQLRSYLLPFYRLLSPAVRVQNEAGAARTTEKFVFQFMVWQDERVMAFTHNALRRQHKPSRSVKQSSTPLSKAPRTPLERVKPLRGGSGTQLPTSLAQSHH